MESQVMKKDTTIEAFKRGDETGILTLLSLAELPTEDLAIDKLKTFLVARGEDNVVIGAIGVELYHDIGLLRSLVVTPSYRGKGLGVQLVHELQSYAQKKGIKTLFLLTVTAGDFFKKLGYQATQRSIVPAAIAKTEEFKNICPVSAVCLFKNLGSP